MSSQPATSIVVGVDGSPAATEAALWAAAEARRRRIGLRLLSAYSELPPLYPAPGVLALDIGDAMRTSAAHILAATAAAVREVYPDLLTETAAVCGHPVSVLEEASRTAEVTVVGSQGRGRLSQAFLGSTAARIAVRSQSPLVVVRPSDAGSPAADGPVMVGVDGSPDAHAAIGFAFDEAAVRRTTLLAVHTWGETPYALGGDAGVSIPGDSDTVCAEEHRLLSEQLAGWTEKYPDVHVVRLVGPGRPAVVLLDRSHQAPRPQLAVVGSRGRGGFTGLLLGSVSGTLIAHAGCPVAVVRA